MPIYRVIKDKNFSVISNNTFLKDSKLSFGAIGLMTLLLMCKDDTRFSVNFICTISGKGVKTVIKYLNELKRNNYVIVKKENSRDGFKYTYYIYESNSFSPVAQNPTWECPPMEMEQTNKYKYKYKQDKIDKSKMNLCFLTEYIIEWNLIKLNDINLFKYDDYLKELLNIEDTRLVIEVVSYVSKRIIDNNYLDENNHEIINLLTYFKESCSNNIKCMKARFEINNLYDIE